jgi:hypothetical protein
VITTLANFSLGVRSSGLCLKNLRAENTGRISSSRNHAPAVSIFGFGGFKADKPNVALWIETTRKQNIGFCNPALSSWFSTTCLKGLVGRPLALILNVPPDRNVEWARESGRADGSGFAAFALSHHRPIASRSCLTTVSSPSCDFAATLPEKHW